MNAATKTIGAMNLVGLEHRGAYHEIGNKFGLLMEIVRKHGWPFLGCLGIYFDDPMQVSEDQLRSMACAIVPFGFEAGTNDVESHMIPAGEYAVKRHVGPYNGLAAAWNEFYAKDLPNLGFVDAGAPFEIYVSDPRTTPEPELITDLYIPIKER